jgi:RNA polymerase sigma factor (TIGR02999 family)
MSRQVTQLLRAWAAGDRAAYDALAPLVYDELRRIAGARMRHERDCHTLQPTALIHEAYLRMLGDTPSFENRAQFFAAASNLMRRILVDNARRFRSGKRGGGLRAQLDEALEVPQERRRDVIALDDALSELARFDERKARIVELRHFGGLTGEEIAQMLGISTATVTREARAAEAWMHAYLKSE